MMQAVGDAVDDDYVARLFAHSRLDKSGRMDRKEIDGQLELLHLTGEKLKAAQQRARDVHRESESGASAATAEGVHKTDTDGELTGESIPKKTWAVALRCAYRIPTRPRVRCSPHRCHTNFKQHGKGTGQVW